MSNLHGSVLQDRNETSRRHDADALLAGLLSLVERAGGQIDTDPAQARGSLRHASSLLRIELDRRDGTRSGGVAPGDLTTWQLVRVTSYIDRHLAETITVREISAIARRSPSHFARAFRRTTGQTPFRFIIARRLQAAQRLMLTSDTKLSDIALQCGFADQAHFTNRFRASFGTSPAAWRRQRRAS